MGLIYPILRNLKIDLKRKMILFGLFSLAIFSIMCNLARSIALLQPPFIYGYFWATTETTVAIICASIPAIRPLFDKKAWVGQSKSVFPSVPSSNQSASKTWITADSEPMSLEAVSSAQTAISVSSVGSVVSDRKHDDRGRSEISQQERQQRGVNYRV
jgi:hypothetical protein